MSDTQEEKPRALAVVHGNSMLTDSGRFEHTYRVAKVFAGSQLIPSHLRSKIEDVMIALHVAERLGEDPLTVMQNIYVVQGKAGWLSSYMVARINKSGLLKGRIKWREEGTGADLKVTAYCTLQDGDEISATASMRMAMAEGWVKNQKYSTMPEHMLRWRSVAFLQRLYFPDVMLGMPTAEELEDTAPVLRDVTPKDERPTAAVALEAFAKADTGQAETPKPKRTRKAKADDLPPGGTTQQERHVPETLEPVRDEAYAEAKDYLDGIMLQLKTITSMEELSAAHELVKETLANHPDLLGEWNAARIARERQLDV